MYFFLQKIERELKENYYPLILKKHQRFPEKNVLNGRFVIFEVVNNLQS